MSQKQKEKILEHMRSAGHITVRQAMMDYSIQALPRRMADLRADGFVIVTEDAHHPNTKQRYVRYKFADGSPRSYAELRNRHNASTGRR